MQLFFSDWAPAFFLPVFLSQFRATFTKMYLAGLHLRASLWTWSMLCKSVWETLTSTNSSCKFTVHIGTLTSPNSSSPNLGYSLHFSKNIYGKNGPWTLWIIWLRVLHFCKHQSADTFLMLANLNVSISRFLGHTSNLNWTSLTLIISIKCIYSLSSHPPGNG